MHITVVIDGHRIYKTLRVYPAGGKKPELFNKPVYEYRRQGKRLYLAPNFVIMDSKAKKIFDTGYEWGVEFIEATGLAIHGARARANLHL